MKLKTTDAYPSRIYSEPKLIERQDPVMYAKNEEQHILSQEELSFYERNGYLFFDSLFNEEEVRELSNESKRIWTLSGEENTPEVIREPGSNEVRSVFEIHRSNEVMKKLSENNQLLERVSLILGSQAYVHQSRINFKKGFTGKEFYWHSDFETWHVEDGMPRMRALSCSIALEDNYSFNGPLMVIPGSHRQFLSCVGEAPDDHYKSSLRKQEYGVPDQASLTRMVDEGGISAPTGKAGSVLFFDCNLMHGSNGNITPYSRNNVFIVYNSVHNKLQSPYSGKQPRPDYIAARS
ncbi:ectoine hydroxylase [Paenibacillus agricola]|uniref:Ectoine hydroxylase n=1 Tax=Paenibacillus agricola TaxID=2716264 RepID=A0ABX0JEW3_9BACL|nr:ectoine hydroxylase [Paenibacillus agricola]NHN33238.1 ectoine hydroxylase [Paenibacillus agricola]